MTISKNPCPSIARSMGSSVFLISPALKILELPATAFPIPMRPVPVRSATADGASCTVRYRRSSNETRLRLKPEVLTLARLFATVSMLSCCAFIPVAPIYSESIMVRSPFVFCLGLAQQAEGAVHHVVLAAQQALARLEVAHGLDQPDHLAHRHDVRCFHVTLAHARLLDFLEPRRIGAIQAGADRLERRVGRQAHHAQRAGELVALPHV